MNTRNKLFIVTLIAIIALTTASTSFLAPTQNNGSNGNGAEWVIVVLDAGANADEVLADHNLTPAGRYSYVFNGFLVPANAAEQMALAQDDRVQIIEPDVTVEATGKGGNGGPGGGGGGGSTPTPEPTPDPAGQTLPTGVDRIDAEGTGLNYSNLIVAVLDTGVDASHPDLNVARRVDCTRKAGCRDNAGNDGNGHGTHNAGIIAAIDNGYGVVGVAPGATIWSLKVLDDSGVGDVSQIVAAMDFIAANPGPRVVNMSLRAREQSAALRLASQTLVSQGVILVAATGNDAMDLYGWDEVFGDYADMIPAAYPEVAAIAAMSDTDGQAGGYGPLSSYGSADYSGDGSVDGADDTYAWFSNFSTNVVAEQPVSSPGAGIDLVLPGVDIYSTWTGGGYNTLSGTSAAAAHASGLFLRYIASHGAPSNAAGVYAARQALIDAGMSQGSGQRYVDTAQESFFDSNFEPLGWAGN